LPVVLVNQRQARDYARALGILAKTDGVDARVLTCFAQGMPPFFAKEYHFLPKMVAALFEGVADS
jgi:hypothetical protein